MSVPVGHFYLVQFFSESGTIDLRVPRAISGRLGIVSGRV